MAFKVRSGAHLTDFVAPAAPSGRGEVGRKECRDLHRDCRGPARRPACKPRLHRAPQCQPVDPVMRAEPFVLGGDHRFADDRRDVSELHPLQPPRCKIDPLAVDQPAVAIVKPRLARMPCRHDTRMAGQERREGGDVERDKRDKCHREQPSPAHARHIRTSSPRLGTCARMSGEYIASTRVGGRLKRPVPFRRTA